MLLRYFDKIVAHPDPCNPCELVTCILESIKRIRCHTALKKTLITSEQLQQLYKKLEEENINFFTLRNVLLCVLSYMGLLRFSEVTNLKISVIVLRETRMPILLKKAKLTLVIGYLYQNCSDASVH